MPSWNWSFSRKDSEVYGTNGYAITVGPDHLRVRYHGQEAESQITAVPLPAPETIPSTTSPPCSATKSIRRRRRPLFSQHQSRRHADPRRRPPFCANGTRRFDCPATVKILRTPICTAVLASVLAGSYCDAQSGITTPNATVIPEALSVYSEMSSSSTVVQSLKKDDPIIVDFEVKTNIKWCSVRLPATSLKLGFVACASLARKQPPAATGANSAAILFRSAP